MPKNTKKKKKALKSFRRLVSSHEMYDEDDREVVLYGKRVEQMTDNGVKLTDKEKRKTVKQAATDIGKTLVSFADGTKPMMQKTPNVCRILNLLLNETDHMEYKDISNALGISERSTKEKCMQLQYICYVDRDMEFFRFKIAPKGREIIKKIIKRYPQRFAQ